MLFGLGAVFRCLSTTATKNTETSKGTITNQENSETVGVVMEMGLVSVFALGLAMEKLMVDLYCPP